METVNQNPEIGSFVAAVIVAAGSSRRMGFDKLLAPLAGVPVLLRTLRAFEECDEVGEIVVVASGDVAQAVESWRGGLAKLSSVVPGGAERHLSVWNGLRAVSVNAGYVAVHDGGRPLITSAQIAQCVQRAKQAAAVACARPVTETLKRANSAGCIVESIDRTNMWIMETPQIFRRALLMDAYQNVLDEGVAVTDEVSAMQMLGVPVCVVENTSPNIKITFPSDLALAERLLSVS